MPHSYLPFKDVANNILNQLESEYSVLMGRYTITPIFTVVPNQARSNLTTLINRWDAESRACRTSREDQKDAITQLVNKLRPLLNGDEQACREGSKILLGCLFHRYFRLINEDKLLKDTVTLNGTIPGLSLFNVVSLGLGPDLLGCRLFLAIRKTIGLPEIMPGQKLKDVLSIDFVKLDAVTIVDSLECFQKYMLKKNHYLEFPHFNQDNFKWQLEEIIATEREKGAIILAQFNAIQYLQSLVRILQQEHMKLKEELESWSIELANDFQDLKLVERNRIDDHLDRHIRSDKFREKIKHFLDYQYVVDSITGSEEAVSAEFYIDLIIDLNLMMATSITIAASLLTLHHLKRSDDDEQLRHLISRALNDPKENISIDSQRKCLMLADQYVKFLIKHNEHNELMVQFFGDFRKFQTALSQFSMKLEMEEVKAVNGSSLAVTMR